MLYFKYWADMKRSASLYYWWAQLIALKGPALFIGYRLVVTTLAWVQYSLYTIYLYEGPWPSVMLCIFEHKMNSTNLKLILLLIFDKMIISLNRNWTESARSLSRWHTIMLLCSNVAKDLYTKKLFSEWISKCQQL